MSWPLWGFHGQVESSLFGVRFVRCIEIVHASSTTVTEWQAVPFPCLLQIILPVPLGPSPFHPFTLLLAKSKNATDLGYD